MEDKKLEKVFAKTSELIKADYALRKEKGEDFNIFSILRMDSNETKTHSAMLVALLNPKNNHYQGIEFLKLFLKEIHYDYKDENLSLVKVKAEHHLGKISKDYTSGGFIDILISFPSGKVIAIENKIYAGDQPKQLYRYSLYKKGMSTLYYLNLDGAEPSDDSLGSKLTDKLTENDYSIISYNKEIINWLEQCMEGVDDSLIVKNAMKQYQVLLKNLTNSMNKNLEKELQEIIINNLDEAKFIYSHYENAVSGIKEKFRKDVCNKLNSLNTNYKAELGNKDASKPYSPVWLKSEITIKKGITIGIESFSGKGQNQGRMFVGVLTKTNEYEPMKEEDYKLASMWPLVRDLKTDLGNHLNLSSANTLKEMYSNTNYYLKLVDSVVSQTMSFVKAFEKQYLQD